MVTALPCVRLCAHAPCAMCPVHLCAHVSCDLCVPVCYVPMCPVLCAMYPVPMCPCALCCVLQGEGLLSLAGAKPPVHVEYRDFCRPLKRLLKQMGSGSLSAGKATPCARCQQHAGPVWCIGFMCLSFCHLCLGFPIFCPHYTGCIIGFSLLHIAQSG